MSRKLVNSNENKREVIEISKLHHLIQNSGLDYKNIDFWSTDYKDHKVILDSGKKKFSLLRNTNNNLSHSIYEPINSKPKIEN